MKKMRLCFCVAICLMAHSVFAVDFDVSDKKGFVVLKQKDGVDFVFTAAIRKSQISSVTLEKDGGEYRIVVTTSMRATDSGNLVLKEHRTGADKQGVIESAFNEILELLVQE